MNRKIITTFINLALTFGVVAFSSYNTQAQKIIGMLNEQVVPVSLSYQKCLLENPLRSDLLPNKNNEKEKVWSSALGLTEQTDKLKLELQTNRSFLPASLRPVRSVNSDKETRNFREKSRGKALLLSLLLPGAGEYYADSRTMARSFFISEVVLWASYISFQVYGDWRMEDARIFAATHAGANVSGKPADYFVSLGNYLSIYEYNETKRRYREFDKIYPETLEYFWEWDSDAHRGKFKDLRIAGDRAHHRAVFVVGGILANHLLSAIDAVWRTYKYNQKMRKAEQGFHFHLGRLNKDGEIVLTISKRF